LPHAAAALFFSTYETSKKAWAESSYADRVPLAAQHMTSAMAGEVVCCVQRCGARDVFESCVE
jgi:hypothetical protein